MIMVMTGVVRIKQGLICVSGGTQAMEVTDHGLGGLGFINIIIKTKPSLHTYGWRMGLSSIIIHDLYITYNNK